MRTEDGYFIRRCLGGETESFAFLVDKYRESVFSFAYAKLRNFDDAEDVTQEVFLKAYEKLHTLRRWDNFAIWLHTIAGNLCVDLLRSGARRFEYATDSHDYLTSIEAESTDEDPRLEILNKALDNLPEIYRQVLTLYYLGDMNSEEISRSLGVSPGTVRQRLSRARSELREDMLMIMGKTFEQYKLRAGFTFRIMEMVKHIKINPISVKPLPWGLAMAAGFIAAIFGISQHVDWQSPSESITGSVLSSRSKVLEVGEIPVDILDISKLATFSNQTGSGGGSGSDIPSLQNALFMAPQAGDKWTKKADALTPRTFHGSSVVAGKIYIFGGNTNLGATLSSVEEYDPIADKWSKKADMPEPRSAFAACTVNDKIYIMGGLDENNEYIPTVEEYDPLKDKWVKKLDIPTPRMGLSASAVNGKIYTFGGSSKNAAFPGFVSTVEEYDPMIDKWTEKAKMPTSRAYFGTSAVNGKIYAIGGWNERLGCQTVEEYDPKTDKWSRRADMPTARFSLSACTLNDRIYAMGGAEGFQMVILSAVEDYDPATDIWTRRDKMPIERMDFSTSVLDGRIYAIGGSGGGNEGWEARTRVDEYSIGTGQSINLKGKFPATWGEAKIAKLK